VPPPPSAPLDSAAEIERLRSVESLGLRMRWVLLFGVGAVVLLHPPAGPLPLVATLLLAALSLGAALLLPRLTTVAQLSALGVGTLLALNAFAAIVLLAYSDRLASPAWMALALLPISAAQRFGVRGSAPQALVVLAMDAVAQVVAHSQHGIAFDAPTLLVRGLVYLGVGVFAGLWSDAMARQRAALRAALRDRAELQRQAERARAETLAVLDAVDDGISVIGRDGDIVHLNRALRERLLARWGTLPTTGEEFLGLLAQSGSGSESSPVPAVERALRGEPTTALLCFHGRDGESRWVSAQVAPIREPGGEVVAAVMVSRDITEMRDAIARDARLEGAVKTARLVAHELNNKLGIIAGYGELVAEHSEGETALLARPMVTAASEASEIVERLQRLIRFEEIGSPVGPMLDLGKSAEHS
jgi:PAS domain-containing protein